MSDRVHCDEHGDSATTFVCVHITDSLSDGKPRGFLWSIDDDGEYQAVCPQYRETPDDQWEARAGEVGRILCFGCYQRAAKLNGVDVHDGSGGSAR